MKALVTGAKGQVGQTLCVELAERDWDVIPTDIDEMDVTYRRKVFEVMDRHEPDVVFHLAAKKLAVEGELEPGRFAITNISGTQNVADACRVERAKLILVSTCKAADPETAYGASKLIAERITLNAGGVVCRFFNVPEAGPSVFTLWSEITDAHPIPYTDCWRYFVSLQKSVEFLIHAAELPTGRYAPEPGPSLHMREVAKALYPERMLIEIPRRRGDRVVEPKCAVCETFEDFDGFIKITGAHDPVPERLQVAA